MTEMLTYTTFRDTTAPMEPSEKRFKIRLKSTKNLCLEHRFFDEIRQIHRFFYVFRQKLQILCRNQARSIQALQVGYFSRRDELLATCSVLLATCHVPRATRTLRNQALVARRFSRTARRKTAVSPAIFEQHLNKNFY